MLFSCNKNKTVGYLWFELYLIFTSAPPAPLRPAILKYMQGRLLKYVFNDLPLFTKLVNHLQNL